MNAQTPTAAAQPVTLPDFAVGQIALLRAVAALGQCDVPSLMQRTGKTNTLVNRDLRKLITAGLVTEAPHGLTPAGEEEIARLFHAAPLAFEDGAPVDADANPVREPAAAQRTTRRHDQIHIGDKNPRKTFDPEDLEDLAADIAARGLKTNLHLRTLQGEATTHELIAGERRWRAISLGIERGLIAADYEIPVLIEEMTDEAHRIAALLENIQRVDLNPLEEAEVYDHLVRVEGRTTAEVAAMANKKNREYVQQRIRLNRLTPAEKTQMRQGSLTFSEARRLLAGRPDPLDLTPRQAMVLAEVITAPLAPTGWPSEYCHVAFAPAAADAASPHTDADLVALIEMGLLVIHDPEEGEADYRLALKDNAAYRLVDATLPLVCNPRERRAALLAARAAVLGSWAAEELDTLAAEQADPDDPYKVMPQACAWLNGPFAYSPEQQAIADAIAAHDQERRDAIARHADKRRQEDEDRQKEADAERQKREAEDAAGAAFLADVLDLEARQPPVPAGPDFGDSLTALLITHGWAPPFTVQGDPRNIHSLVMVDSQGKTLIASGDAFQAVRRFQVMAINAALGFAPFSGPPLGVSEADEQAEDDEESFLDEDDDADDGDDDTGQFDDEDADQ